METMPILLIPEKNDIEFERVCESWTSRGGVIRRLGKYWIKDDELSRHPIAIYGNQAFSLVLAQIYNVILISPDDTLIAKLEPRWTKRTIQVKKIGQIPKTNFPVFIKPVIPKIFLAGVFKDISDFKDATSGLAATEEVLVSNVVSIDAEVRSFVKNGIIQDLAIYEGVAEIESGKEFLVDFLKEFTLKLPSVLVIDLAYNRLLGWFILEFNACWGAGLNNCNAQKIVDCIIMATQKN